MGAKKSALMSLLLFACVSLPAWAQDTELEVAKVRTGNLSAGQAQSFVVSLKAGDFAEINVDPSGKKIVLTIYDPSGKRLRGAELGPGAGRFDFVADGPGKYRVEVTGRDKAAAATFAITFEKVVTLAERLGPAKPQWESPRIKRLRASIESGDRKSIDAFWLEVEKQGAPLIEPQPGDNENMLVTYLWKGSPDTRNVFVIRLPYAAAAPDEYFMNRLGDTDVWYKTDLTDRTARFEYSLAPNVPRLPPVIEGLDQNVISMIATAARTDPLNPKRWRIGPQSVDSPEHEGRSFVEMPDAPPQPWLAERPEVASGRIEKHQFQSALLKNEREIAVYLPAGYSATHKPYPLLVLFDEIAYLGDPQQIVLVPTPTILDNLISAKRIPAMMALFIGNVQDGRDRELGCNPTFSDVLSSELLTWMRARYNVTADPKQIVVGGSSLGGLAAACAGLYHPETFGNILSQSGAFHRIPAPSERAPDPSNGSEPNWLTRQFIASRKLPLRFYLEAGSEELDVSGGGNAILLTNRTLRDVLLAKGYEVHFHEFAGGHDYLTWRGTLADGLIALLGDAQ